MLSKQPNIWCGNCVELLPNLKGEVDLVVTSPPYENLRDYHGYEFDVDAVAYAIYQALKPGGVVVWVIGDKVTGGSESGESFYHALAFKDIGFRLHDTMIFAKNTARFPARRTGNRYSQMFEYMFVFSKGKPKTANLICDKKNKWAGHTNWGRKTERQVSGDLSEVEDIKPVPEYSPRGNIWRYVVSGGLAHESKLAYKHPATFPLQLAKDHILTWSNEGDLVVDPMAGSGTTLFAAKQLNRRYIGIDVSEEYCQLIVNRLQESIVNSKESFRID